MPTTEDELYVYMEHMQDVAGWKSIIFLPFNYIWKFVILFSVLFGFVIVTNRITYHNNTKFFLYMGYLCDVLYLVDVFCSILHVKLVQTRKLRNFHPRSWFIIIIDCMSLIPLEVIYGTVYLEDDFVLDIWSCMFINRIIRIYRLKMYFMQHHLWAENFNIYFIFNFMELFVYGFVLTHTFACIFHILSTEEDLARCPENEFSCKLINEMIVYFLMVHRFIGDETVYNTTSKRITCCFILTLGYFFVHGFMCPSLIFSCVKRLKLFFEFWNRYKRLKVFISNLVEDDDLRKRTLSEFRMVWTYGKGEVEPQLLASFPLSLKKNIYSDLFWEAMRHSDLLQNISIGCKRAISLGMVGNFYLPGSVFWHSGELKACLLYISSGNLQVMAQENSQSPIMSFSGGTILGEHSLCHLTKSRAYLRVATFSEIHVLHTKDFCRIIKNYPADRKIVFHRLQIRLKLARMSQMRKKEIYDVFIDKSMGGVNVKDDAVKWIKNQFRDLMEWSEVYAKQAKDGNEPKTRSNIAKALDKVKTSMDHTSAYLPLLNLSDDVEVHTDLMCLKTSLPWVIDPQSHFIRLWEKMILASVFITSIVYPVFIAWWPSPPEWLFNLSMYISLSYVVDIFIQMSTAVKTKDGLIVRSGAIFLHRLKSIAFYADVISAIPFQLLFRYTGKAVDSNVRIGMGVCLIKIYRVAFFFGAWSHSLNGHFSMRVMIKYLYFHSICVYWSAAVLQLSDIECLFYECREGGWYNKELEGSNPDFSDLAAAFFAVNFALDVPDTQSHSHTVPSVGIIIFCTLVVELILVTWMGDFSAAYMLESSHKIKFTRLVQSVMNFMNDRKIIGRVRKRVLDNLVFQWHYDCGDYLTQERSMIEDASLKLKAEVNKASIFNVIQSCDLFKEEDEDFVWNLCERSTRLTLPANSIIVTFGVQTMTIYLVYKGFLQLNSFLPKDTQEGLASPVLYGPGKIVPLVVALNQMPSGVTVRALTDCELIVLGLEDLLTTMHIHGGLKDMVEAIKLIDLQPFRKARLTISKITDTFNVRMESGTFQNVKRTGFGRFAGFLLMRRAIHCEAPRLLNWELFRIIIFIFGAITWPVVFGLVATIRARLCIIYTLLALDSCTWIDFYLRLHIAYYSKMGIFITDTVCTAKHYLTTTFIVDFLMFLPYLHCLYIIATNPLFDVDNVTVAVHCLTRIICLYRFFRFITYNENITSLAIYLKFLGYLTLLLISVNCLVILKLRDEITWIQTGDGRLEITLSKDSWITAVGVKEANEPFKIYLVMLYCMVCLVFRSYPFFKKFNYNSLTAVILLPSMGLIFNIWIHGFFTSKESGSNHIFTVYQYHMKSLTRYLSNEKAEDSLTTTVVDHYEHEWARKKGEDLHKIFSRFPNILNEDLLFPIYRKTLTSVSCLSKANEGFYRALSRSFTEVHFSKGSTIIFEQEVNSTIYFIHTGQCYVKEHNTVLYAGSLIGDIRGLGKMTNNIVAMTHVVLLSIPSHHFFLILNDFYQTEKAFFSTVENFEDFIISDNSYSPRSAMDAVEAQTMTEPVIEREECEFEPVDQQSKSSASIVSVVAKATMKEKLHRKIYPNTMTSKILEAILVADAIVTVFCIPIIISLGMLNTWTLVLIYTLDAIWLTRIITKMKTVYVEPTTGDLITKGRSIVRIYLQRLDGFAIDVLCVFPFELIYKLILYYMIDWDKGILKYCFSLRLLRLVTLWISIAEHKQRLTLSQKKRWLIIFGQQLMTYNFFTAINLLLATDERMVIADGQTEEPRHAMEAFVWSYLSMFNLYSCTGIYMFPPTNMWQICFYIFIPVYSIVDRNIFTSEVLSILNVTYFVKSEEISKMQILEKYLAVRDVSLALKKKSMSYASDLLEYYKAEVIPTFLQQAPYFIKVQIMTDLYLHHLSDCFIFEGLDINFLKQLTARLQRHIYFPSDIIVEKGDVDCNMYFVDKGEVSRINSHKYYPNLYYETDLFVQNEYFAVEQGLHRSTPHKHTFRAKTMVDLLHLNYFTWLDLRMAFPEVNGIIAYRMFHLKSNNFDSFTSTKSF